MLIRETFPHMACFGDNSKLVEKILEYGCNPMATDKETTPFHLAKPHGSTELVNLLVGKCQCVCDMLDSDGNTALHYAIFKRKEEIVRHSSKFLASSQPSRILMEEMHCQWIGHSLAKLFFVCWPQNIPMKQ